MIDFNHLVTSQYLAAFRTLKECVDQCPEEIWKGPVGNNTFNQSAFHALFFADVYLNKSLEGFETQDFHKEHTTEFGDYEEWKDQAPTSTYSKSFILAYLDHCRSKMNNCLATETEDDLKEPAGFEWLDLPRAELHIYNIRHIQHHAAQLILRLRLDSEVNIGWQRTGWE